MDGSMTLIPSGLKDRSGTYALGHLGFLKTEINTGSGWHNRVDRHLALAIGQHVVEVVQSSGRGIHLAHSAGSDCVETYWPRFDRRHSNVGLVARERRASLEPLTFDHRSIRSDWVGASIWLATDASRKLSQSACIQGRNRNWRNRPCHDGRRIA
jgi:hypothetical protein